MKAEIVAVGTEILLGEIVDTNGPWIARQLPALGIDLLYKSVVGDNFERMVDTLGRAWNRSDLILVTGGLGPTTDDLTREAIAATLAEEPRVDAALESHLRDLFTRRGNRMPEQNVKQAWLIPSARAINNPRGTAPGWWVERDGRIAVCMPGVPTEMERMWTHEVRPTLAGRSTRDVLILRTLKTVGLGESTVDEKLRHLYGQPGIGVGTYARADGVHIRIGAKAANEEAAYALIRPIQEEMEGLLGDAVWGRDADRFEDYLAARFGSSARTLAVIESGTGGFVISLLADAPGASAYLRSAVVASSADDMIRQGAPPGLLAEAGARSAQAAMALARTARGASGTDYGLGITGVLGSAPEEGTPPGTVHIAVAKSGGDGSSATITMNQGRLAVKRRAATTAMMLLRRSLLEVP